MSSGSRPRGALGFLTGLLTGVSQAMPAIIQFQREDRLRRELQGDKKPRASSESTPPDAVRGALSKTFREGRFDPATGWLERPKLPPLDTTLTPPPVPPVPVRPGAEARPAQVAPQSVPPPAVSGESRETPSPLLQPTEARPGTVAQLAQVDSPSERIPGMHGASPSTIAPLAASVTPELFRGMSYPSMAQPRGGQPGVKPAPATSKGVPSSGARYAWRTAAPDGHELSDLGGNVGELQWLVSGGNAPAFGAPKTPTPHAVTRDAKAATKKPAAAPPRRGAAPAPKSPHPRPGGAGRSNGVPVLPPVSEAAPANKTIRYAGTNYYNVNYDGLVQQLGQRAADALWNGGSA